NVRRDVPTGRLLRAMASGVRVLHLTSPVDTLLFGVMPKTDVVRVEADQLSLRTRRNGGDRSGVIMRTENCGIERLPDQPAFALGKRANRHLSPFQCWAIWRKQAHRGRTGGW